MNTSVLDIVVQGRGVARRAVRPPPLPAFMVSRDISHLTQTINTDWCRLQPSRPLQIIAIGHGANVDSFDWLDTGQKQMFSTKGNFDENLVKFSTGQAGLPGWTSTWLHD